MRPGAGRKRGVANKVTRELRELAREYTEEAVSALVRILRDKTAPASTQVAAATALLDRGYGRPAQHVDAEINGSLLHRLEQMTPQERHARLIELHAKATEVIERKAHETENRGTVNNFA